MTTIKAIVRNGQLEVDEPIDLPDGTVLNIPVPGESRVDIIGLREEDWPTTPEEIDKFLRWFDTRELLEFTPQDRATIDAIRKEDRAWELAHWDDHSKKLEKLFP